MLISMFFFLSFFPTHSINTDGRWITDDYYESKVLEDISAKGLQAGDLVGAATGGGGGVYRAGPTTLFGGNGWGPYSDGPLNAVRKSVLSLDGVTEENWNTDFTIDRQKITH